MAAELVPFDLDLDDSVAKVKKPPRDPIGAAEWLMADLMREYHSVCADTKLPPATRRDLKLKFAAQIVRAMPNAELYAARQQIRQVEADAKPDALGGKVERAASRRTGSIRAAGPRRKRGS